VFLETIRAEDTPAAFQRALEHYRNREGGFHSNNAAALKVTGNYKVDPKYMAEVLAMPKRGVERAAEREKAAFNEQFLREYVQLIQSQPDDMSDFAAVQRSRDAHVAFAKKWPDQDPMKSSREALQAMRMWGLNGNDAELRKSVDARVTSLVEQRATLLRDKFFNAPKLLEDAMDFYRMLGAEVNVDGKLAAIRSQAKQLAADADSNAAVDRCSPGAGRSAAEAVQRPQGHRGDAQASRGGPGCDSATAETKERREEEKRGGVGERIGNVRARACDMAAIHSYAAVLPTAASTT
jgi:hypothetical protein